MKGGAMKGDVYWCPTILKRAFGGIPCHNVLDGAISSLDLLVGFALSAIRRLLCRSLGVSSKFVMKGVECKRLC